MIASLELTLLAIAGLLVATIAAGTLSSRLGLPALIGFVSLGLVMGIDGPGGIAFDDYHFAQTVGSICLIFILFSGGLDTVWRTVRASAPAALVLATLGVVTSAGVMALSASLLLGLPWAEAFLLGSIVASTDAAAVFAVLRAQGAPLDPKVQGLIEFESGSNDPMAIFLVGAAIAMIGAPDFNPLSLAPAFAVEMALGAACGIVCGLVFPFFLNRMHARYAGLGLVASIAAALAAFGSAGVVGGNGFLAAYLAGLVAGNRPFAAKRAVSAFQDGTAWMAQVLMFLTLGLLATPSRLIALAPEALALTAILLFVARPASVFACLAPFGFDWRDKLLISWAGLRGAVPIVLATFPIVAGVPDAFVLFDVVFFVVLVSSLVQAPTLPLVTRLLARRQ